MRLPVSQIPCSARRPLIHDGDQNVLGATGLELVDDAQPEFGALGLLDPDVPRISSVPSGSTPSVHHYGPTHKILGQSLRCHMVESGTNAKWATSAFVIAIRRKADELLISQIRRECPMTSVCHGQLPHCEKSRLDHLVGTQ